MNLTASNSEFDTATSTPLDSSLLSGVSWGAVFAGAASASALSLVLLILGVGLGLSTISPWSGAGVSVTTFGVSTLLWLTVTQVVASIIGGYIAGRLRVKWVKVHNDEVFFRDTAHGFIAWAIASLGVAFLATFMFAAVVNNGARAASTIAGGVVAAGGMAASSGTPSLSTAGSSRLESSLGYSIDSLFRTDPKIKPAAVSPADNAEVTRIFTTDLLRGELPVQDKSYIAEVVAARTGSSQANAEQRVSALFTDLLNTEATVKQKAKEAADVARKATAYASLWMVVSLLAGAFSASLAATFGGKLRDKIY